MKELYVPIVAVVPTAQNTLLASPPLTSTTVE